MRMYVASSLRNKRILLLLVLLICFSLVSCGEQLTEGEVYQKKYEPAHSVTLILPHTVYNGRTSTVYCIPYIRHYPDTWTVYIKAFQNNEWVTASYCVTEDVYDSLEIGSMFEYDPERDLKEAPYTQEKER